MNILFNIHPEIISQSPRPALVIGTFAAVPYVHLQLEARRRLYPEVPVLVHDDASPAAGTLAALCRAYGADFSCNAARMPACKGDLSVFVRGLAWAGAAGADVLVKFSRRFIPVSDWRPSLAAVARESQSATLCAWTTSFGFGFRSECVGLSVARWAKFAGEIAARIEEPGEPFVEGFLHDLARRAALEDGEAARAYDARTVRPPRCDGYGVWDWMGTDRCARTGNFLWHDWAQPEDYAALARSWGLLYEAEDFADPNAGWGNGK